MAAKDKKKYLVVYTERHIECVEAYGIATAIKACKTLHPNAIDVEFINEASDYGKND